MPVSKVSNGLPAEPARNCSLCPRLTKFRNEWRKREPKWFNAPVPCFGEVTGRLAIVGLAPGLRGANRTGRPFTGDWAGILLYDTLLSVGFADGQYLERPDDGLRLKDCLIVNSVRCVPPENKPTPEEIRVCNKHFLAPTLLSMPNVTALVALGRIAHDSVLRTLDVKLKSAPFSHGAKFSLPFNGRTIVLYDSYHCSRYNTNTGVLTPNMFRAVFTKIRSDLDGKLG